MARRLKSEIIKGKRCTFEKYPNGYVEGKCPGYLVGSHKTKRATVKSLRRMIKR